MFYTHKNPGYQNFMSGMAQKVAKLWIPLLLLSKPPFKVNLNEGKIKNIDFWAKIDIFSILGP